MVSSCFSLTTIFQVSLLLGFDFFAAGGGGGVGAGGGWATCTWWRIFVNLFMFLCLVFWMFQHLVEVFCQVFIFCFWDVSTIPGGGFFVKFLCFVFGNVSTIPGDGCLLENRSSCSLFQLCGVPPTSWCSRPSETM